MKFSSLKSFACALLGGANVVAIAAMLVVGYSDRLHPVVHPVLANAGLSFPLVILANLAFLLLWLLVKPRMVVLPLLGFMVCYVPVRTYFPINIPREAPSDAFQFMTYNAMSYRNVEKDSAGNKHFPAFDYVLGSGADIVCLQESWLSAKKMKQLREVYPYADTVKNHNGNALALASRWPIVGKEHIRYESGVNGSGVFYVDMDGDTLIIVSNHFETNTFSEAERRQIDSIVSGKATSQQMREDSRQLMRKLIRAASIRGPQVDSVACFLQRHAGSTVILCGDFNSCPNSYTRTRLARDLTDCFVSTGIGFGWTYNRNHINVRIDHILCSDDLEPYHCHVDTKTLASDHYPVRCWFKKKHK